MPHTLLRFRVAPAALAAAVLLLTGCGGGDGAGGTGTATATETTGTTTRSSTPGGTAGSGATTVLGTEQVTDAAGIALSADQVDELVADCQGGAGVPGPDTTCTLVLPIVLAPCTPDTPLCLLGGLSTSGTGGVLVLVDRRADSVCAGDGAALCAGVGVPAGVVRSLGAGFGSGSSGTSGTPRTGTTGPGTSRATTSSSTRPPAVPGATPPTRLPGTTLPPLSPPTPATRVPLPTRETLTLTPRAPLLSGATPTGTSTP